MQTTATPAARLPPEIVLLICEAVTTKEKNHVYDKRFLSNASLVCTYWCRNIRPHLFMRLEIACIADARQLCHMASRPGSMIPAFVRELILYQRPSEIWMSSALPLLSGLAKHLSRLSTLELSHYAPYLARDSDFPRRDALRISPLTPAFMSGFKAVKHLTLLHLMFKTFRTFLHLVRSFPLLEYLKIDHIEWREGYAEWHQPVHGRLCNTLANVEIYDAEPPWLVIWLFASSPITPQNHEQTGFRPIARDEIAPVEELLQHLHVRKDVWAYSRIPGELKVQEYQTASIRLVLEPRDGTADTRSIVQVNVDITEHNTTLVANDRVWSAFDAILPQLPHLKTFHIFSNGLADTVGFYTFSFNLVRWMPVAYEARLLLVSLHGDGRVWINGHVPTSDDGCRAEELRAELEAEAAEWRAKHERHMEQFDRMRSEGTPVIHETSFEQCPRAGDA